MSSKTRKSRRVSEIEQLRQHNQRLTELFQLALALRSDDNPQELCARVANGLLHILESSAVLIWLLGPKRRLSIAYAAGQEIPPQEVSSPPPLQVRSGEGLVGQLLADGEPRIIESADAHRATFGTLGRRREALYRRLRQYLPERFDSIAIGMRDQERMIGAIEIFAPPGLLSTADIPPLQMLADRLATALNISRVYSEMTMQRMRLAAFDAVVTAISTASDLQEMLSQSLLVVMNVVGATAGAILLVAPNGERMELAVHHGLPEREAELFDQASAQSGPLEEATHYGQPTVGTVNIEGDEFTRAAIPLLAGGTVVGALALYGPASDLSGHLDWSSLVAIGSQIGIAVANARLYEESQRERRRLATVIDSMAEGVAICDASGELVLANEAAADLLGLSSLPPSKSPLAQASNGMLYDLQGRPINPDQSPLGRALQGEIFHDYRVLLQQPRGDVILSFSGSPLRSPTLGPDAQPDGAVVLFRDVTIQRQLEQAKDEFLAVAAHELRSPLASIKGYADLLLRREMRAGTDERELRGVRVLTQQVDHLVRLVDNLLDLSRLDAGRLNLHFEPVNLSQLAELVVLQSRTIAPSHIIELETDEEPVFCVCDTLRIRQVLTNLLSNAIRYSPPETEVTVAVRRQDDEAHVVVMDHGPGIPLAYRERLFNRYYRVPGIKRQGPGGEGLGLGLYLSREIVLLHGGRIWVDETSGGGATFIVTLPTERVAEEEEHQPEHVHAKETRYALQG